MSWFSSMNGQHVSVTPAVRRSIGLDGIGMENTGVIDNIDGITQVIELGQALSVVGSDDVERLTRLDHGSNAQLQVAESLSETSLEGLKRAIDDRMPKWFIEMADKLGKPYAKYRDWAHQRGWFYPVVVGQSHDYMMGMPTTGLRIEEPCGLSIIRCDVRSIEGAIRQPIRVLLDILSEEALKQSATMVVQWRLEMMCLEIPNVSIERAEEIRGLDGQALIDWYQKEVSEDVSELEYCYGSAMDALGAFENVRDISVAQAEQQQAHRQVLGRTKTFNSRLARVKEAAIGCPPSVFRDFAISACDTLRGKSTMTLIASLREVEGFECLPGGVTLVDDGSPIVDSDEVFNDLHEMSMNGEDYAWLPMSDDPTHTLEILTRITMAEQMILMLTSLCESYLSESKAVTS